MNKKETTNFILCDMGIQAAFAKVCRDFQRQQNTPPDEDWLIIDNDTGEIISPQPDLKKED